MRSSLPAVRIALALLAALPLLAPAASSAQAPKVGSYYKDSTHLGFRIKVPKDWEFIPPQPDEKNLIGKYEPANTKSVQLGRDFNSTLFLEVTLVQFDNRPVPEEEQSRYGGGLKSLDEWLERHEGAGLVLDSEKSKDIAKTPAVLRQYIGKKGGEEYRLYVAEFELEPEVKLAFIGNGPGEKKWRKYETAFTRMVRAFKRIPVSRAINADSKLGMGSIRAKKKAKLEAEVARAPGWELYETDNYFVVTNNEDQAFIRELMGRLEAIRETYEELYPPTLAEEIRQEVAAEKAKARQSGEGAAGDDEEEGPERPRRSTAGRADPMELSRASVVRVCKDQSQYHSYGGPGGSAGYWSSYHEELVIYDDKKGGGRGDTWITLNHEAFHQYIFYFFGNLAPHSWYNEGNGDFFSGYQLKNSRFKLKKNSWREGTIKEAIRDGSYVPLKKIVKYTQREYYANPGLCYAQGWSFIWFLRTGEEKNAPGWNDDWNDVLTTYLRTLAVTGDLEAAVDQAFEGVDWDEMEESWKAYIG